MIIPVGFAQVNFIYTGAAVPTGAEWTLGLDITGYGGDPLDAAADISTAYSTEGMAGRMEDSTALTGILVKYGPNVTGPSGQLTVNIAGTQSASSSPANVALLWHKNTALGGRAGRGRAYFPGVPENATDDAGILSGGYVSAGNSEMADFLIALSTVNLDPVLLHAAGSPIGTPTPITSITLDSKVATQRRRLRR